MSTVFVRRVFICTLLLGVLFVSGCASRVTKTMESWVGHHQSDLILDWGPPQQTAGDGKGGSILVYGNYVNLGQTPGQATVNNFGNVTYTAPQQQGYQRTRMFYVNSDGYIYAWRWQGL
ncbi:MAG: hypothetical protein AB7F79_12180 [Steroidobacteraceae bacterium]